MTKTFIWIGLLVGSTVGGLLPLIWGDDVLSVAGIVLSTVGGIGGVFGGYKLAQSMG
jgi:hypothetical protein